MAQHPNATFLADATGTYNCHSYAFHLSKGQTPIVWMNQYDDNGNPNVYKYWTDGSYIQVCNESDADKVHYYTGDHSAVMSTTVTGKYESKWDLIFELGMILLMYLLFITEVIGIITHQQKF